MSDAEFVRLTGFNMFKRLVSNQIPLYSTLHPTEDAVWITKVYYYSCRVSLTKSCKNNSASITCVNVIWYLDFWLVHVFAAVWLVHVFAAVWGGKLCWGPVIETPCKTWLLDLDIAFKHCMLKQYIVLHCTEGRSHKMWGCWEQTSLTSWNIPTHCHTAFIAIFQGHNCNISRSPFIVTFEGPLDVTF